MKKGRFVAISYVLGMVGALMTVWMPSVEAVKYAASNAGIHSAVTLNDHEAMAKSYEDAARKMQAKAQEQERLLEQYKAKSYLYGRQAQDLQSSTHALARFFSSSVPLGFLYY